MVEAEFQSRSVLLLACGAQVRRAAGVKLETCFTGLGSFHQALPVETDRPETLEESR
jgi:hypothetical protein